MGAPKQDLETVIASLKNVKTNLSRTDIIDETINNREAILAYSGAVAAWTPRHSTGRNPKDTYIVRRSPSESNIDWNSPNNNAMAPALFDELWADALNLLKTKARVYVEDRVIGADPTFALPTRVVCTHALQQLFVDNMFQPIPKDINKSIFAGDNFTLLVLPFDDVNAEKYAKRLRTTDGKAAKVVVAMDVDRKVGLIMGTCYCGAVKKTLFTVMDYLLPEAKILPLHCSANEGKSGDVALFLGLSGTGKTTLSSVPDRALIGDDEHGWSDNGIANFEYGCYAKLINLNPEKEPEIYQACFHKAPYKEHGAILENAMVYPDGTVDLNDNRYTENSRASYPLSFLSNIKKSACGGHPKTIIFLTADATGVLPPVAKLNRDQAMLWFLMGYTSKLAGTETGVTEPSATFSRFFGSPFMPRNPEHYLSLFAEKIEKHGTTVYLVNTGWSGGPYGVGKRMDITVTRRILDAALNGSLRDVTYIEDKRFHLQVPTSCPGVDAHLLNPKNTWTDKDAFEKGAAKLAAEFSAAFDKSFIGKVRDEVRAQCPGK